MSTFATLLLNKLSRNDTCHSDRRDYLIHINYVCYQTLRLSAIIRCFAVPIPRSAGIPSFVNKRTSMREAVVDCPASTASLTEPRVGQAPAYLAARSVCAGFGHCVEERVGTLHCGVSSPYLSSREKSMQMSDTGHLPCLDRQRSAAFTS